MNESLSAKLREIIAAYFGVSPGCLTNDSDFRDDLGADRLDRLELMIAIEDQVAGIEIDDVVVDQIDTIGDLMHVIEGAGNGGLRCGRAAAWVQRKEKAEIPRRARVR